jgi:hypothetical protein
MIDLNDASIQSEGKGMKIFNGGNASPGVENCALVRVEKAEGYDAVDFFFADSTGAEIKMREWFVDYDREGADRKEISQAKRMKHILTKFLPEGTPLPQAQNSEDLLQKVMQALGTTYVGVKVRLKVTYKESGYLQIPPYVPFLELMTVPANESRLSFSNIDITEKPSQDAPEDIATAAASSTTGAVTWP